MNKHHRPVNKRFLRGRTFISLGLLAVMVGTAVVYGLTIRGDSSAAAQAPVTRSGTKLLINGKQWKFAGLNADKWFGCWGGAEVPSDAQLDKYFRELNPHSLTRIWPYYGANSFAMMDRIVTYAEKYDQYLAPAMFDGNSSQCGTQAINKGNPQVNIDYMRPVVTRYAKGTGARATNAIAFWEASNEVCGADSVNWLQAMANAFKQMDPNTLVGSGSMPQYCFGGQDAYERAHAGNMDLISVHEYENGVTGWAGPAATAAKKLNKPWYAGEDGFCCNGGDTGSWAGNAAKLKGEFDAYLALPESAGMMYWALRLNAPSDATSVSLTDNVFWDVMKNYRHAYQATGGSTGGTPTPTTTPATPIPTTSATPATPTPVPGGSGSINNTAFTFKGSWAGSANSDSFQGDDQYSRTAGDTYSLTFTGTQAKILTAKAPQHGTFAVKIDNGSETTVDLYSAVRENQQLVYTSQALASGIHTLTVRVTGAKNAAASDMVVVADRIDVTAGSATTPTPSTAPTTKAGDVNGDGKVNTTDLSMLLGKWGQNYTAADFNKDGIVNATDLSMLLGKWTG